MKSVTLWFSDEEYAALRDASQLYGTLPSAWLKELFQQELLRLNARESAPFMSEPIDTRPESPSAMHKTSSYPSFRLDEDDPEDM